MVWGGCGTNPETVTPEVEDPSPAATEIFVDFTAESGLDFVHFNGMSGELYLAEITCGGGAFLDYDRDGDLDVYLLQGKMIGSGKILEDALVPPHHPTPLRDRLYRNDLRTEDGRSASPAFADVTDSMGVTATGYGCSVAVGDVDNDGWPDIYVGNLGPDRLLRNEGDGTFRDVTPGSGLDDSGSTVTATFFDYDRDGWLDLFVGHNVTFDNSGGTVCYSLSGAPDYCGPGAYPFEPDRLFRNRGTDADGRVTFEDVTAQAGLGSAPPRPTLGSTVADFDGDGWLDLYVANDGEPNHLWRNLGDGSFAEEAMLAGCAVNSRGAAEASMGVTVDDYDRDGDPDVFLTHLIKESNTLYRNDGSGTFSDVTARSGLGAPSLPFTSFGAGWLDFDNDGWLDLFVASGAVTLIPSLVAAQDPFPLHQTNQLFRNLGDDEEDLNVRFAEVSDRTEGVFARSEVSRGAAFGDVDNDGDEDLLIINNGGPARLLINRVGQDRSWLGLSLAGIGTTATLLRDGGPILRSNVRTDGSYSSASDPRILFGLADETDVDTVAVRWSDASEVKWSTLPTRRYYTLMRSKIE